VFLSAVSVRRNPNRPTASFNSQAAERAWFLVDAEQRVLGRLAAQIASVLRGKHKPSFTPHSDQGDFVVVVNARKLRLTGRKLEQKMYRRHTGYMGGLKETSAARMLQIHPDRVLRSAVQGMLPKGPLGRRMLSKLKIYADAAHPHAAQKPQPLEISA
jgi:large subunit ribosomal protein L13